ncbi:MAG: hypothetical protein HY287_14855 [Planctomycetes bacterium]|nr:hypothetical protein [Planctomycetota bacterium]MBI3835603.1 hypothetical protein [Planctomycetota bacterium]
MRRIVIRCLGLAGLCTGLIALPSFAQERDSGKSDVPSRDVVRSDSPLEEVDAVIAQTGLDTVADWRNTPPGLAEATFVSHAGAVEPISVVITLDLRDHAGVDALLAAQHDPTSPQYHQWITPEEFQSRFGPLPEDLQAARNHLAAHGFTNITQPTSTMIAGEGDVRRAEQAFQVRINNHIYNGRSVFSNDRDPILPPGLANKVAHVGGLDNLAIMYPKHGPPIKADPRYLYTGNGQNYYLPRDNQVAYGEKAGYFDLGKKGIPGAELAVASSFNIQLSDVNDQLTRQGGAGAGYNLLTSATSGAHTVSTTCVPNTGSGTGCSFVNGVNHESLETNWDVSVSCSVANDNHIGVYLAQTQLVSAFGVVYQYLADRSSTIKVVTHSWGLCLTNMPAGNVTADDNAFAQAAAGGQAWFVATGDSGANDCGSGANSVDYPAASPYVTGAGGSEQNSLASGTFGADGWMAGYPANGETACTNGGGGQATTGPTEPRPSWQTGTGVPAGTKRLVPDISMHYGVCGTDTYSKQYIVMIGGSLFTVAGTSGDAPQWAGYWAVGNQVVGQNLGQAGPTVFRILRNEGGTSYANSFHDVTTGSNGGFSATVGYDQATGVGTPKFNGLYSDLALLFAPPSPCTTDADCNDSNACTTDTCNIGTGTCSHAAVNCDDANACTTDGCDAASGCTHTAVTCSDGNSCTTDACNPATGCTFTWPACGLNDGCCGPTCTSGNDPNCCGATGAACTTNSQCCSNRCRQGTHTCR